MRIVFDGSSQIKHIIELYEGEGWDCVDISSNKKSLFSDIKKTVNLFTADMVYLVGGVDLNRSRLLRLAHFLKKKIIVHWIGTDVFNVMQEYKANRKMINHDYISISGSKLLQCELASVGVKSSIIPIVPLGIAFEPLPMPEKHAVLVYVPEYREEFYNMKLVKEIAKHFPDLKFHIVANTGENDLNPLDNILYEGFLSSEEMKNLYKKCTILFRYPTHDGLSMMLLEALGVGRNVIYKYEFPFAKVPASDSISDITKAFEEILLQNPQINYEAVEYINTNFSKVKQIERYKKLGII